MHHQRPENLGVIEKVVEEKTGRSVDDIRTACITDLRRDAETRTRRRFRFYSAFPFVGRGNVLREHIEDREKIDRDLEDAFGR